jgi:hypothetical protein
MCKKMTRASVEKLLADFTANNESLKALKKEVDTQKAELFAIMDQQGVDSLQGLTLQGVRSFSDRDRFDSVALKKENITIYNKYVVKSLVTSFKVI